MTDLREFLAGESLTYQNLEGKRHTLTYRVGVGIYVDDELAEGIDGECMTDVGAIRVYHSITRRDADE
jgi:hypothetical protein